MDGFIGLAVILAGLIWPPIMAFKGRGYRGLYFGGAIVALILGFMFMSVAKTPDLPSNTPEEQALVQAGMFFAVGAFGLYSLAVGCLIAGVIYRQAGQAPKVAVLRACPFCAEPIRPEAIVCRHCGRDLPSPMQPVPPPQSPVTPIFPPATEVRAWSSAKKALVFTLIGLAAVYLALVAIMAPSTPESRPVVAAKSGFLLDDASVDEAREKLGLVVRSTGDACARVSRVFKQGENSVGDVFWNADCGLDGAYSIQILNDGHGSTRVVTCAGLKTVAAIDCFKTFQEQGR